ncbi:MAG: DnaD domain protein [Lachnospiraceae bacterium]|nr:DnaD domain protein [Lachnospiraceae bacterium]
MKIYTDTPEGSTVVQNSFIDQYMPQANGEFVKVYLYLLRCANSGRELSLSSIADVFEHTEKDVRRAIIYWERQNLIQKKLLPDGSLESLTFKEPGCYSTPIVPDGERTETEELYSDGIPASPDRQEPDAGEVQMPMPGELSDLAQQDLKELFFVAEQYLGRPLSSSEQNDFVYYYHTLKFSTDLIEYLLEYCITKGTTSRHYMKKVAQGWAEAGITSVQAAKKEGSLYNKNYFQIMKAFGIRGRSPVPTEQETMSRWLNEFGFTMDLILEACSRTMNQLHKPSFSYAESILEQWHKAGVHTMADVEAADRTWEQKQAEKKAAQKQPPLNAQWNRHSGQTNRFNRFEQRSYDYENLEKKVYGKK